jgi:hypothetical protein
MYSDVVAFLIHTDSLSFLSSAGFGTKMEDYVLGFPHVFQLHRGFGDSTQMYSTIHNVRA